MRRNVGDEEDNEGCGAENGLHEGQIALVALQSSSTEVVARPTFTYL